MVSVIKVNHGINKSVQRVSSKTIAKTTLPVASTLGVLAGASMGPTFPPDNVVTPRGMDVEDPFIDKLIYTGQQALDTGSAIVDAVSHGVSSLGNIAVDAGSALVDGASDLGHQALDALGNILDSIG